MKYLFSCALILTFIFAKAQKPESFLLGKWKVLEVSIPENASAMEKKALEVLKPNLLKTTFIFKENNRGECNLFFDGVPVELESKPSPDIYWTFNPKTRTVVIKEWKKRYSVLMSFVVNKKEGKTYFSLNESTVVLRVAQ